MCNLQSSCFHGHPQTPQTPADSQTPADPADPLITLGLIARDVRGAPGPLYTSQSSFTSTSPFEDLSHATTNTTFLLSNSTPYRCDVRFQKRPLFGLHPFSPPSLHIFYRQLEVTTSSHSGTDYSLLIFVPYKPFQHRSLPFHRQETTVTSTSRHLQVPLPNLDSEYFRRLWSTASP